MLIISTATPETNCDAEFVVNLIASHQCVKWRGLSSDHVDKSDVYSQFDSKSSCILGSLSNQFRVSSQQHLMCEHYAQGHIPVIIQSASVQICIQILLMLN